MKSFSLILENDYFIKTREIVILKTEPQQSGSVKETSPPNSTLLFAKISEQNEIFNKQAWRNG